MTPTHSYLIWFTPRTGSTALTETISKYGYAGTPGEHLLIFQGDDIREKYKVKTYEEFRDRIWNMGSTANDVFGVKYAMHRATHDQLLPQLELFPDAEGRTGSELFDGLFPNVTHLFLTRIHKVRQAVSWWKAIRSDQWHRKTDTKPLTGREFAEANYDLAAFRHLLLEISLRESAIAEEMTTRKVTPAAIHYEHFLYNPMETVNLILQNIGLAPVTVPPAIPLIRTTDQVNALWELRLKADLQSGWEQPAW